MAVEQCLSRTKCSVKVSCDSVTTVTRRVVTPGLLAAVIPEKLACLEYPSLLPSENRFSHESFNQMG